MPLWLLVWLTTLIKNEYGSLTLGTFKKLMTNALKTHSEILLLFSFVGTSFMPGSAIPAGQTRVAQQ